MLRPEAERAARRVTREYEYVHPQLGPIYYYVDLDNVRLRIVQALEAPDVRRFLDLGTGDGGFAVSAARRFAGAAVVSVELSTAETLLAARAAATGRTPVHYVNMDAYQLGFPERRFDCVGSFLALQDICFSASDLHRLTKEAARVLKPGGTLVLAAVTPEDVENERQALGIEVYRYIRAGYFSKAEIAAAFDAAGVMADGTDFFYTGVNFTPEAALAFVRFECGWWVETYGKATPNWRETWAKFGPRVEAAGGLEVDAKVTVMTALKPA